MTVACHECDFSQDRAGIARRGGNDDKANQEEKEREAIRFVNFFYPWDSLSFQLLTGCYKRLPLSV